MGNVIATPDGLIAGWCGHLYQTSPGTNIYDELVTVEKDLWGGWYEIMSTTVALGDYVEFALIDKDGVLGLAPPGTPVELAKYVRKDYVNPNSAGRREEFISDGKIRVVPGLYFRSIYVSVGALPVDFKTVVLADE